MSSACPKSLLILLAIAVTVSAKLAQAQADPQVRAQQQALAAMVVQQRATISEPPEIAAEPWAPFDRFQAVRHCDPGILTKLERFGRDCGIEGIKFLEASIGLLELVAAPGETVFADPTQRRSLTELLPEVKGQPPRKKGEPVTVGKTVGDVATVVGVPVNSAACLIRGAIRLQYGEGPEVERMLAKVDAATDIYQLVGLLQALGGAAGTLNSGGPSGSNLGQLADDAQQALKEDLPGALDTGLGPTQAPGWFDRIAKGWTESRLGLWTAASSERDAARERFDRCDIEGALAKQEAAVVAARRWARGWRELIELAEIEFFCHEVKWRHALEEAGWETQPPEGTSVARDHRRVVEQYRSELQELRDFVLAPPWSGAELDRRRREAGDLENRFRSFEDAVARLGRDDCEVSAVLSALRGVDQNSVCFEWVLGAGARQRLRSHEELLRGIQLAEADLRRILGPAAAEGLAQIRNCRFEHWRDLLRAATEEFDSTHAPAHPLSSLSACWNGPWPLEELPRRARERQEKLAAADAEARRSLESARDHVQNCRYDAADGELAEAGLALFATDCPLGEDPCSLDDYEPVLCSMSLLDQEIQKLRADVVPKHERFLVESAETERVGGELIAWADELEPRLEDPAARCLSLPEAEGLIRDLRELSAPAGCPEESAPAVLRARQRARSLQLAIGRARSAGGEETSGMLAEAEQAYRNCDPRALGQVRASLEALGEQACSPDPSIALNLGRIDGWLRELEASVAEAERIEREANARILRWNDHCEESALTGVEALISNLSSCGTRDWPPERRGELGARLDELAGIQRTQFPALQELRRWLTARIQLGEGYLRSLQEAAGRGTDICTAVDQVDRIVADTRAWLSTGQEGLPALTPETLPRVCYGIQLGVLTDLAGELRAALADLDAVCPEPRSGDSAWAEGGLKDDGAGEERPGDSPSSTIWKEGGLEESEPDPCREPQPEYAAALARVQAAAERRSREALKTALAELGAIPNKCPNDALWLADQRDVFVAADRQQAKRHQGTMRSEVARSRARRQAEADAWSQLADVIRQQTRRVQERSRSHSTDSGPVASGVPGTSTASRAGSTPGCEVGTHFRGAPPRAYFLVEWTDTGNYLVAGWSRQLEDTTRHVYATPREAVRGEILERSGKRYRILQEYASAEAALDAGRGLCARR